MSSNQTDVDEKAFRQKDYELKVTYLSDQFTRMWNRFNYFVAIETALIGGNFLIPNGHLSYALAIVGILMSLLWYVMGAQDRYLVRLYRHQVKKAADAVTTTILTDVNERQMYRYVGQVDEKAIDDLSQEEKRLTWLDRLSGWRREPISTTRLAALFPLFASVLWVVWLIILFFTR